MYLSDHSKNLISAKEKVAELIKQRDQLRNELAAEREKVRALRLACERIVSQWDADHDTNPIGAGGRMYSLASKVLGSTEDAQ